MSTFKDAAFQILKEVNKPLHVNKITEIAIRKGILKTHGKSPVATMNAQLVVDINSKKNKSRFVKVAPSTYTVNKAYKEPRMKSPDPIQSKRIDEEFVKRSIIIWLSANGWGYFEFGGKHKQGVDIRAKHNKYGRFFFVETKGQGKIRQHDEVAFVYSLGQIVTRMRDNKTTRNYYALGLPETSAGIAKRRIPWQVAKKLLLSVLSVSASGAVRVYKWSDLKQLQRHPKR